MQSNYRHIRLEDRNCPDCEADIVAICKNEGEREKFWYNCAAPQAECGWGRGSSTYQSENSRVTAEEAREQFDSSFE